jgi:hypothetical protein
MENYKLTDYERGEYDCLRGHECLPDQSQAYLNGYSDQYAQEQIDTEQSRLHLHQWGVSV